MLSKELVKLQESVSCKCYLDCKFARVLYVNTLKVEGP